MVSGPPPWVGDAGFCVIEDVGALDVLDALDALDDMERRGKHWYLQVTKVWDCKQSSASREARQPTDGRLERAEPPCSCPANRDYLRH